MDTADLFTSWNDLPEDLIVQVFRKLKFYDAVNASLVCSSWRRIYDLPLFWHSFDFNCVVSPRLNYTKVVEKHGEHLRTINFILDQSDTNQCKKVRDLLFQVSGISDRKLQNLKITFAGENPCFYSGKDLIEALYAVLKPSENQENAVPSLKTLDLSKFTVILDDGLLELLSEFHKELQMLDLQNEVQICRIAAPALSRFVGSCRMLQRLHVYSCSLTEECLQTLMEVQPPTLKFLSIYHERADKFKPELSSEIWKKVCKNMPNLRAQLYFDSSCPLDRIEAILKPEIPTSEIYMENYVFIHLGFLESVLEYHKTLEKLVLHTPISRDRDILNRGLLEVAEKCKGLRALHVFCVLDRDNIDRILAMHPKLAQRGSYTLRDTEGECPWVPGNDC